MDIITQPLKAANMWHKKYDVMTLSDNTRENKEKQIVPVFALWGLVKDNVGQIQFCEALCPKLRMQTPEHKTDNVKTTGY